MRGADAITAARIAGWSIERIDVDVLPARPEHRERWTPPGVEAVGGRVFGRIEVYGSDNPATLDFRCCYGVPVLVVAGSYEAGWPVAEKIAEAEPLRLHFAAPEIAVRYSHDGMQAWEM